MTLALVILTFDFLRALIPTFRWGRKIRYPGHPWSYRIWGIGWLRVGVAYIQTFDEKPAR